MDGPPKPTPFAKPARDPAVPGGAADPEDAKEIARLEGMVADKANTIEELEEQIGKLNIRIAGLENRMWDDPANQ